MMSRRLGLICGCLVVFGASVVSIAGGPLDNPAYRIVSPGNTGIPGLNNMMFVTFGPDGRLWTHGRDFFWQQGGVAALDFGTSLWKTYSSAETPLDQWCNDMAFAADGSAWIACDNVVARLHPDGQTFTAHTPASTGVLVSGAYGSVSIAPDDHVWAANYGSVDLGGGLFEFNGTQWTKHEEPWMVTWTGVGFAPPLNVFARSNGDVLATFLSSPGCMGRYRNGQWTQVTTGPLIIDMEETADGTLYGVGANGAYRLNDATNTWQQIGSIGSFALAIDPTNEWLYVVSNSNGVSRYNGTSWSPFATFPGIVSALAVAPNGDVWITAETSPSHFDLHHYTPNGQLLRVYNRSNTGMPNYFPPWMYLDRDGRMWMTDALYGASRLEPDGNWRNFGIYNGQEEVYPGWVSPVGLPWWQTPGADFWSEAPNQVYHDTQGNFWFRGPNYIARSVGEDLSNWTFWQPGQNGLPWLIDAMGEDAQGNIWVTNEYSLFRLSAESWIEVPIGIPGQFATIGLSQGKDGHLYASRVATAYRISGNAATPLFSLPDGFGVITDLEVDASGTLWIGTPNNGVIRRSGNTTTVFTPANSGLAELAVVDIAIRPSDGLVAVSTSQGFVPPYDGGVAIFDGNAWTSYDYGESFLPHYGVGDVQFDADGHLWIGVLNFGAVQVFIGENSLIPGDIDGDGDVDLDDSAILIAVLLGTDTNPGHVSRSDVNGDGSADGGDVQPFVAAMMGP